MLWCSANGICAICSMLTKNITTRLVRTYHCTRTRRSRVPSRLSVARWRCRFWVDCTTNISERRFPTGTAGGPQRPRGPRGLPKGFPPKAAARIVRSGIRDLDDNAAHCAGLQLENDLHILARESAHAEESISKS